MSTNKLFAFVLMPFGEEFRDTYQLGIKAAAEREGVVAERVDEQYYYSRGILDRIYDQIKLADVIIADMSGRNPNVFYEVGYAHALGKTCLLLTRDVKDIPFDLTHHRHVIYGSSIALLNETVAKELSVIKAQLINARSLFRVNISGASGRLSSRLQQPSRETGAQHYLVDANVYLKLRIHNELARSSPEIDSLYLYTKANWSFSQENSFCKRMDSDIENFSTRHIIEVQHKRVPKDSWIEIMLYGRKLLGSTEKSLRSYHMDEALKLRINTLEDTYVMEVPLLIKCEHDTF